MLSIHCHVLGPASYAEMTQRRTNASSRSLDRRADLGLQQRAHLLLKPLLLILQALDLPATCMCSAKGAQAACCSNFAADMHATCRLCPADFEHSADTGNPCALQVPAPHALLTLDAWPAFVSFSFRLFNNHTALHENNHVTAPWSMLSQKQRAHLLFQGLRIGLPSGSGSCCRGPVLLLANGFAVHAARIREAASACHHVCVRPELILLSSRASFVSHMHSQPADDQTV